MGFLIISNGVQLTLTTHTPWFILAGIKTKKVIKKPLTQEGAMDCPDWMWSVEIGTYVLPTESPQNSVLKG